MNSVRAIEQLNKRELESAVGTEGSWHTDYRDTAFVYIGGLPFELSEGDIITIFSQYGEPVWVKLARDKETGKSRGFAWIKYEDQRSCDLAVDNLGGSSIMDRIVRVDHARYKPGNDEDMRDNTMGELDLDPGAEEEEDGGRKKRRKTESGSESDEDRPMLPEEIEMDRLMEKLDEDDPMRDSMIKRQQEKVDAALNKLKKTRRKEKERARRRDKHHRRDRSKDRKKIKDGEDGAGDRHREKDRRKIREEDEDSERERHSRRRDDRKRRDGDDSEDERLRRKERHHKDSGAERSPRRRNENGKNDDRRRRRSLSGDDEEDRSRSKRSPIPYRARSPRRSRS